MFKTFHLTANIHQRLVFSSKDNARREYLKHQLAEKDKHKLQLIRETEVIKAYDLKTAQQKFKDIVVDKYSNVDGYIDSDGFVETNEYEIHFIDFIDQQRCF